MWLLELAKTIVKKASFFVLGLLAGYGLFYLAFGYDFFTRFKDGFEFHMKWKAWGRWNNPLRETVHFAIINQLEFFVYIGVPATLLLIKRMTTVLGEMAERLFRKENPLPKTFEAFMSLLLLAAFGFLAIFAKTKGEVARIWIFLAPFCIIPIAAELYTSHRKNKLINLALFFVLQGAVIFAIARNIWDF